MREPRHRPFGTSTPPLKATPASRMHHLRFTCLTVLVAATVFLFPISSRRDLDLFWTASRSSADVAILGNSVVDHSSKCDAAKDTIPALVATSMAARTVDLSNPGQTMT